MKSAYQFNKKQISTLVASCLVVILSLSSSTNVNAQGDLLVMPKRVVFEGSKRSEELNLANIGKDTATYSISFVQYKMKEDGSFQQITTPDSLQNFADQNLRFYPRTVTLAPNEAQTVKVQVSKTSTLAPGEYRSHIYFRAIPKEKPLGETEVVKDSGISVKLIPVFGITIPAIIRVGENNAAVALKNSSFKFENDTIPVVNANFNRTGNMSVYGDITVDHVNQTGQATRVAIAKGVAVYTPTPVRHFKLMLRNLPGVDYHTGKLIVKYSDQSSKPITLAEEEINLN